MHFGFFKVFRAFFLHVLRYHFETWHIHLVGGVTYHWCQVWVPFQSGHFDLLYSKKIFCIYGLKNFRGIRFGTHTYIVSVLNPTDFHHGWAIFGPLADKNTRKQELVELPASEKFSELFLYARLKNGRIMPWQCPSVRPSAFSGLFFNMLWDINLKLGIYIQWVARHVKFELHHNWVTLT